MLVDRCNRKITYLRVSVTDRCNLRCVYCMPPEGVSWQPHESIMRYEEITQIVQVAAEEGIREVRLTGGEPLVRKNLAELVGMIAAIPGIEDISLTTNGILLADKAKALKIAGLKRINVSLDTMEADKYARITRGGNIQRVFEGLEKAEECGLDPIKLNMVLLKGVNDGDIRQLAELSRDHRWEIRFIELMPVKNQTEVGRGFPRPAGDVPAGQPGENTAGTGRIAAFGGENRVGSGGNLRLSEREGQDRVYQSLEREFL